jgi:hypothetical protein
MNEGCMVVGRLYSSYPFIDPHPVFYETARAVRKNNFRHMKFWRMKNQCLQDEGIDCSFHRMNAFVWDFEGS